jgi:antitoxin VapB
MALSIRNPEVKRLADILAERDGRNVTETIKEALSAALRDSGLETERRRARLAAIAASCAALPDLDGRPEDEILGYGPDGAF